ncbi:MAG: low affinity iron permease family protein [Allosphingosinicella sp.]
MRTQSASSSAREPSRLEAFGCWISEKVADVSAHPYAQVGLILLCLGWALLDWKVDLLTAALSVLAITLTQMVLNRQHEREKEAHRRDVALHAKLDELLIASKRARDELAGIEELEEEEIEALKATASVTPLPRRASAARS